MAYKRNPRRRVIRGASADELRRGGRRTSEEFDPEGEADFVRLGSSVIGTSQDVVQRIGGAIIGGDFGGNARGQAAIDIQIERRQWPDVPDPAAVASGDGAIAFGQDITASGEFSIGMGNDVSATGYRAVAFGVGAFATADGAIVFGTDASANAENAIAIGDQSTASGINSLVIGENARASGRGAIYIDLANEGEASGDFSVVLGGVGAAGDRATALGSGAESDVDDQAVVAGLTFKLQIGRLGWPTYAPIYESVITTSDAAPATGNVATFADVDRIADGGVALSALAPLASPTFTGVVTLPAGGNAAAPVLAFAGDANTGLHQPSADRVMASANGQRAFAWDGASGAGRFGVFDTSGGQLLFLVAGENLTADRALTWITGDADRSVTISNSGIMVVVEDAAADGDYPRWDDGAAAWDNQVAVTRHSIPAGLAYSVPGNHHYNIAHPFLYVDGDLDVVGDVIIHNPGGRTDSIVTTAISYTASVADDYVIVNGITGNVTITLPLAASAPHAIEVIRADATSFTVTVQGTSGQTINGETAQTLRQFDALKAVPVGTFWLIG